MCVSRPLPAPVASVASPRQRFQLWFFANFVTVCICATMLFAQLLLYSIECLHRIWPKELDWALDFVYCRSHTLKLFFSNSDSRKKVKSIDEILESCGISCTPYQVITKDGYELTLHRYRFSINGDNMEKKSVLLLHGLLQDSDSFVCSGEHSLVHSLLQQGLDVWSGNNRGTKYSSRHESLSGASEEYWNFNIDDLAEYDVPAMIDKVLKSSGTSKLALVGFSQGSAQSFAALSSNSALNEKVSIFIALAPAVRTAAVGGFISHLAASYPDILQTVFGKFSFLPIVIGWQRLLNPAMLEKVVSGSMYILFGWTCDEISPERRCSLYQYIYSLSSVQCVSHWFHVLGRNNGVFCKFLPSSTVQHEYSIETIDCPIAVFSGEKDFVIDASEVPNMVQKCVHVHIQEKYEHIDMIWADSAHEAIFPTIGLLATKF